jgi:hypothetical protein
MQFESQYSAVYSGNITAHKDEGAGIWKDVFSGEDIVQSEVISRSGDHHEIEEQVKILILKHAAT